MELTSTILSPEINKNPSLVSDSMIEKGSQSSEAKIIEHSLGQTGNSTRSIPGISSVRGVILVDPTTHEPLKRVGERWVGLRTGQVVPMQLGFPSFFDPNQLTGPSKSVYSMFNRFAPMLGLMEKLLGPLFRQLGKARQKIVDELRLAPQSVVLEVGVGIGGSIKCLPADANVFGVDYCPRVLRYCQKALSDTQHNPVLLHAAADGLPFASHSFDAVFHVGAFNFFPDQSKALREMMRVTKVGGRVVVADETRQCAISQRGLERLACKSMAIRGPLEMPTGLLPSGVGDVQLSSLWGGKFYVLSFTKTR
jgi:ubiquinone/menaquinone biosynthesis C-methylase UbiE